MSYSEIKSQLQVQHRMLTAQEWLLQNGLAKRKFSPSNNAADMPRQ